MTFYHHLTVNAPPASSTVTSLIADEAAGAEAHDISVVLRIYAPGARHLKPPQPAGTRRGLSFAAH